jgi:hypothetical protein
MQEGHMTTNLVTFDEVLVLVQRLSPADQARLRAALPANAQEDAERAIQQQKNQAAIELLDAWRVEADATDEDGDDEWWEAFVNDIDAYQNCAKGLRPLGGR